MDSRSVVAIIGSVSPSLAAYHHARSHSGDGSLSRCSRCGHLLVPGVSRTRLIPATPKNKRRSGPIVRCIRQTCATCGHVNNTLIHPSNHPSQLHSGNVTTPPPVTPCTHGTDQYLPPDPPSVPSSHLHPPHNPSFPSQPHETHPQPQPKTRSRKSRPKHKVGLQEMLARNKERQREAISTSSSGLATFLHSL